MENDDDIIRPYNGHNKSEALPNFVIGFVGVAICYVGVMALVGVVLDLLK